MLITVLINIAFITLLERKILGYRQRRLGPNKPSFVGLLQPMADAVKLFLKSFISPGGNKKIIFYAIPGVSLGLVLLAWSIYPLKFRGLCFRFSIIFIIIILRLNIYPVLLIGWGSDNKYSIMGALRGVAQTISYEISFALIILITILYLKDMSIDRMQLRKEYQRLIIISPSILILWVISALAETNRTPFDFAEGESELVSGFNTEFRAWGFATIFMAEYGRIYFLRAITASLFFPSSHAIIIAVFATLIVCFWVWARTTFPRYRYDLLINLAWKRILPTVLRLSLIIVRISLI